MPDDFPNRFYGYNYTGHVWKCKDGEYDPVPVRGGIQATPQDPKNQHNATKFTIEGGKLHFRHRDKAVRVKWERSSIVELQVHSLFSQ